MCAFDGDGNPSGKLEPSLDVAPQQHTKPTVPLPTSRRLSLARSHLLHYWHGKRPLEAARSTAMVCCARFSRSNSFCGHKVLRFRFGVAGCCDRWRNGNQGGPIRDFLLEEPAGSLAPSRLLDCPVGEIGMKESKSVWFWLLIAVVAVSGIALSDNWQRVAIFAAILGAVFAGTQWAAGRIQR